MKRRNILIGLSVLGGGVLLGYPGFKWIRWNLQPDFDYLAQSRNILASLADTIIPGTDSPGARECGVHDFIIKMIKECTDIMTQNKFLEGLHDLEAFAQSTYGKSFPACSGDEREQMLRNVEDKDRPWPGLAGKVQKKYLGSPFFVTLKRYSVIGYCTSEGGATRALRYSHVPIKYIACESYIPGEKAWATS
jgi:hypothetical protein